LFYNSDIFLEWVKDCRAAGITAHIIPGLMPILGYERFTKTVQFCKANVPAKLTQALELIKHDDEKVRDFGVSFGIE
jgi:methylenetetrahydrofolate reductase (NADPH)